MPAASFIKNLLTMSAGFFVIKGEYRQKLADCQRQSRGLKYTPTQYILASKMVLALFSGGITVAEGR